MPSIIKGKFQYPINFTKPNGSIKRIPNPAMTVEDCRMQDPSVQKCMALQDTRFKDGEICLPGSLGTQAGYSFFVFKGDKPNSYVDDVDANNDGISDDEEKSVKMEKHCVWKEDQLGNGIELRLGKSCNADDDCKTSLGNLGEAVRMLQFGSLSCLCTAWCGLIQTPHISLCRANAKSHIEPTVRSAAPATNSKSCHIPRIRCQRGRCVWSLLECIRWCINICM